MKTATVYDLLISCPSDVAPFVDKLEDTINKFNNFYGRENNVVVRTISWKNNSYPKFGEHPQKILNKQIVDKADFVVAVFWTRFGTKTENFDSGTEEEIERMLNEDKQVFLYFLNKPVHLPEVDLGQYSKIQAFREKHKNKGLFFTIPDENALSDTFREHLQLYIDSIVRGTKVSITQRNKLILWVDDCPQNNVYARNILENYGLKFDLALSTERALNFIQNNKYSLIISDMGRKEGSREGYILLKHIRDSGNDIPFIIFSSDGSRLEYKAEAKRNDAQGSTDTVPELVDLVLKLLLNT
ncbi:MAG: response regulator [Nitrososphaerota archaeon]|jgi:CheY-like chemotaxis protein|nr:response regulator [Nitrososphaerota archaeon]